MNRTGYTLIEMVAVIGAAMAVMTIAAALMSAIFPVERLLRRQLAVRRAVDRLADQFRRDVHAAEDVTVEGAPPRCVLGVAGRPAVAYRVERGQLVRETLGEGKPASHTASRSLVFPLPRNCTGEFDQQDEAGRTVVGLIIVLEAGAVGPPGAEVGGVRVAALLDRDTVRPVVQTPPGDTPGDTP